jgi:hypothetical protein
MMASTGMVGWSSNSTVSMVAFLLSVDSTPVAPDETAARAQSVSSVVGMVRP